MQLGWLAREVPIVAENTAKPWGVGFLSWAIDVGAIERALEWNPRAVMLSFGDPSPFAPRIREAGAALIIQVIDGEEARRAVDLGADVIVAQGTEAGGHGAAGALVGTRFQATAEALVDPSITKAIIEGRGEDTERSRVLDIARGSNWPSEYTARTLGHPFLDQWRGREAELAADPQAKRAYQEAVERGEIPALPAWAGEGVDLIDDLPSAADLVGRMTAQAEEALARAGSISSTRRPGECSPPRGG
ncbi:nitronate monooxygenase [Nonomuraea sp. NPDC050786]|uniref:NAD(P)H-dependent flavin oxidoreductase n=1 Tax=Nonomuraea sp. NPDC050786 TaxID=3154840 RepID=UPI0033FE5728